MPTDRTASLRGQGAAVAVVAVGGALGAVARDAVGVVLPAASGFPWGTVAINVGGCLLMGVLVVLVGEVHPVHPLVRPFLGTGVLGGFTTFSTFAVDGDRLVAAGHAGLGAAYLVGTAVAAVGAAALGLTATRQAVARRAGPR